MKLSKIVEVANQHGFAGLRKGGRLSKSQIRALVGIMAHSNINGAVTTVPTQKFNEFLKELGIDNAAN